MRELDKRFHNYRKDKISEYLNSGRLSFNNEREFEIVCVNENISVLNAILSKKIPKWIEDNPGFIPHIDISIRRKRNMEGGLFYWEKNSSGSVIWDKQKTIDLPQKIKLESKKIEKTTTIKNPDNQGENAKKKNFDCCFIKRI